MSKERKLIRWLLTIVSFLFLPVMYVVVFLGFFEGTERALRFYQNGGWLMHPISFIGILLISLGVIAGIVSITFPKANPYLSAVGILLLAALMFCGILGSLLGLNEAAKALQVASPNVRVLLMSKFSVIALTTTLFACLVGSIIALFGGWLGAVSALRSKQLLWWRALLSALILIAGVVFAWFQSGGHGFVPFLIFYSMASVTLMLAALGGNASSQETETETETGAGGLGLAAISSLVGFVLGGIGLLCFRFSSGLNVLEAAGREEVAEAALLCARALAQSQQTLFFLSLCLAGVGVLLLVTSTRSLFRLPAASWLPLGCLLLGLISVVFFGFRLQRTLLEGSELAFQKTRVWKLNGLQLPLSNAKANANYFNKDIRLLIKKDGTIQSHDNSGSWEPLLKKTLQKSSKPPARKQAGLPSLLFQTRQRALVLLAERDANMEQVFSLLSKLPKGPRQFQVRWLSLVRKSPDLREVREVFPWLFKFLQGFELPNPKQTSFWFRRNGATPRLRKKYSSLSLSVEKDGVVLSLAKGQLNSSCFSGSQARPNGVFCPNRQGLWHQECLQSCLKKAKEFAPDEKSFQIYLSKERRKATTIQAMLRLVDFARYVPRSKVKLMFPEFALMEQTHAESSIAPTSSTPSPTPIKVYGTLEKTIIRRVMNRIRGQARACYQQELVKNPKLQGKVQVFLLVGTSGAVKTAKIARTSMNNDAVESCLLRAVKKLRFPALRREVVSITYPFVFRPQ